MQDWTTECDVLVVGSGGGALTGAYTAASQGWRTLVLEKTPLFGGTSAYSGAAVWLPGTAVQKRAGLEDSTDKASTYLRAVVGDSELDRQEAYVRTAPEVVALLERDRNIEFEWRAFPDYYKAPGRMDLGRAINPLDLPEQEVGELRELIRPEADIDRAGKPHPEGTLIGGRALIGRLLMGLYETDCAELRTETAAQSLITENGRVIGVVAANAAGETLRIRAKHGVLLAAGGIEGNPDLRHENQTPGKAQWSMGPRGANTGDLLQAAVDAGAATALLDEAWWCPGVELPDESAAFMVGVRGGLLVDDAGDRYLNESLPYDQFGRAMIEHGSDKSYLIFDSAEGGPVLPAISIPQISAAEHLAAGTWVTAATIEELAQKIGVPAEALTRTVEQFNTSAERGVDHAFHRGEDPYDTFFCRPAKGADAPPNPALKPVSHGPFHAARIVLSDLGTKGGIRTDEDGRALRADGTPIEGLYAAGNTSASLSGPFYPGPGVPLGTAMVFSYRAVQHMKATERT